MYCIKCGVKLADTEKICPLCGTRVFHPDLSQGEGDLLYPKNTFPRRKTTYIPQILISFSFLLSAIIVFLCDFQITNTIVWSGYVIGGLLLAYVSIILPSWFRRPNPVVFVPLSFVVIGAYVLYINLKTGGSWFLSFAFPLIGGLGLLITVLVVLLRYVKRGKLYMFGGFFIALGGFMMLIELLANVTFNIDKFLWWSLYPLTVLAMLGFLLIFFAVYKPAKEMMERKFFI